MIKPWNASEHESKAGSIRDDVKRPQRLGDSKSNKQRTNTKREPARRETNQVPPEKEQNADQRQRDEQ